MVSSLMKTKHDPEIGKRATLISLYSHGTGFAPVDHLVAGFFNEFFYDDRDEFSLAASLPVAYDFRSRFLYNNNILGAPIFELRSSTNNAVDLGPVGSGRRPANYVRSTAHDMLTWHMGKAVMEAEEDDGPSSFDHEVNGKGHERIWQVLRQMAYIRTTKRPMIDEKTPLENSYALGWFRHMLPSSWLGSIGPNFGLFVEPPVINASGCPRLTIARWGESVGFLTAFYTFPETERAVIVMANCSPGRDHSRDLIAQHLVQNLFDM
ncbi:MAG: hypothetical protein Q9196_004857 [Gyalolechia fulgens]